MISNLNLILKVYNKNMVSPKQYQMRRCALIHKFPLAPLESVNFLLLDMKGQDCDMKVIHGNKLQKISHSFCIITCLHGQQYWPVLSDTNQSQQNINEKLMVKNINISTQMLANKCDTLYYSDKEELKKTYE